MIGELKTTRTPRNTHQNHQIGVFLNWGIPKSPWVSILKWSFMTWMISGGPTWWNGKFKSHQSWLDIFNGHATGTDWLEVPIPYMFGLFFRPKFKGISPQNIALYDITIDHLPSAVNFAPRLLRNVWHNVRVQRVQRFQRLRFLRGTGWSASSASAQ